MIGQVVMLRLANQYTLAAIAYEHSPEEVDLRAFAMYTDGQLGVVEVPRVRRGVEVDQWQDAPPWPTPLLDHARDRLMPVSNTVAATMALPPMMVIIRY